MSSAGVEGWIAQLNKGDISGATQYICTDDCKSLWVKASATWHISHIIYHKQKSIFGYQDRAKQVFTSLPPQQNY
jgi:hypothetical protein